MRPLHRFLSFCALAVFLAAAAQADTLELKDGRTVRGRYLGGTQVMLRFEVNGDVQVFRLNEVSAITFDRYRREERDDRGGGPPPRSDNRSDDRYNPSGPAATVPPPPPTRNARNDSGAAGAPSNSQAPDAGDAPPPATSVDQLPPQDSNAAPPNAAPPNSSSADGPDAGQSDRSREDHSYDQYPPAAAQPRQSGDAPPPPPQSTGDSRDRSRDDYPAERDRDRDSRGQYSYAAPGTPITVPSGSSLLVRMIDEVDSRHDEVGDPFHAALESDLVVNNILVARRGSDVYGRLAFSRDSGRLAGSAELQLELTRIIIDGKEFPISTGEYTVKGRGRGGDTARNVGGGAVLGAIIGGIAGGGSGAAIGAGVGGAAGAGATAATRGRSVRVPSETLLQFELDQPVTVTPTQR